MVCSVIPCEQRKHIRNITIYERNLQHGVITECAYTANFHEHVRELRLDCLRPRDGVSEGEVVQHHNVSTSSRCLQRLRYILTLHLQVAT